MSKHASLEPKKTTKPKFPWLVELPPALSSTGKRQRHYRQTKKEAEEFCRQQRIRLENYGTSSTLLPAGKIEEAAAAFARLAGSGASLLEAVEHFLAWQESRRQSVTFLTMFERFMDAKASRSKAYKRTLRLTLPRFAGLHERLAVEVAPDDIEAALAGMTASVRNAFLRNIRAAFNFGIRRGWCEVNPVARIEMQSLKPRKLLLTIAQVRKLIEVTSHLDRELLPYIVMCLFAGIRPEEEMDKLTWEQVNLDELYIEVPDDASKTNTRRVVEMEPVLVLWLEYYRNTGGVMRGPVVPRKNLRKRLRALRTAAGITPWPQDAPRRMYASCWLAVKNDVNKLNTLMGHTTAETLWRHYHKAVLRKDAEAYWQIAPPTLPANVVPIAKAA